MNTEKKTKFIAFSSQKGGVGKTTFTSLMASIMHYRLGYHVAVIDADFPQFSLSKMKARDLKIVMENEYVKKIAYRQFSTINKKAYPVTECKADQCIKVAEDLISNSPVFFDVIFFDLPGTVNTPGILNALVAMNHIFTPITADRVVMESTLIFSQLLQDVIMKNSETSIETMHLFWNQVDGRESTPLYGIYQNLIMQLKLNLMDSRIKNSTRFRKESEQNSTQIFRSTLLPPDERLSKLTQLEQFTEEFLKIIKL